MNLSNRKKITSVICSTLLLLILSFWINTSYKNSQKKVDDYIEGSIAMSRIQEADFGLEYMDWYSAIHGNYQENTYHNDNLGFSIYIPNGYSALSEDELQNYIDTYNLNRWAYGHYIGIREADIPVDDSLLRLDDQYYDLMCINGNNQIISVVFLYDSLTQNISENLINMIISESQKEFTNNPQLETAIHDEPVISELNGQEVYLVHWTITRADGSIYNRTEIIDFVAPILRVVAIDYDDPFSFEEISSGISYYEPEPSNINETIKTQ